jgi:hypothetical protein
MATFADRLHFGKRIEYGVSQWLQCRGNLVMPTDPAKYHDESDSQRQTGPLPELFNLRQRYKAPDLLVFPPDKDRKLQPGDPEYRPTVLFVEVKWKHAFTWYRKTHSWQIGIDREEFHSHWKLRKDYAIPVWLLIVVVGQESNALDVEHGAPMFCPSGIFTREILELEKCIDPRPESFNADNVLYFNHKDLKEVATLEEAGEFFVNKMFGPWERDRKPPQMKVKPNDDEKDARTDSPR